jgi:hypothetical protein
MTKDHCFFIMLIGRNLFKFMLQLLAVLQL